MKKRVLSLILFLTVLIVSGCSGDMVPEFHTEPISLKVATTASLKKPLTDLKNTYEKDNNVTINYTFDSSYNLTENALEGKENDLIILSSQFNMNELKQQNLIDPQTEKILVRNSLVVVAGQDSEITSITDLANWKVYQVAIGDPDKVSSGHIAVDTLKAMDQYDDIESKLVYEDSVKDVLKDITDEKAQAGIVFKTDIQDNDKLKVVYEFPVENYDSIVYPMALQTERKYAEKTQQFEDFLLSSDAQKVFSNYGFTPVENQPSATQSQPDSQESQPAETDNQPAQETDNEE